MGFRVLRFAFSVIILQGAFGWADGALPPPVGPVFIGRFDTTDLAGPRFNWPGSKIEVRFAGTSVSVRLRHLRPDEENPIYYSFSVDDAVPKRFVAITAENNYLLASGLSPGSHTVTLIRESEGKGGLSQFLGFDFGKDGFALAAVPKPRMEVIGDSISAGFGNLGSGGQCPGSPESVGESFSDTYDAVAARQLGMDVTAIAGSGKGVHNNYAMAQDSTTMLQNFLAVFAPTRDADGNYDEGMPLYSFSAPQPALVVIALGTNDFANPTENLQTADFMASYKQLVAEVRAHYPKAPLFAIVATILNEPKLGILRASVQHVASELRSAGDANLYYADITPEGAHWAGCKNHPSQAQDLDLAQRLVSAIRTALPSLGVELAIPPLPSKQ